MPRSTAAEIAGLPLEGAQETVSSQLPELCPDIDWSSYADRHKQQPWFVLSALLLAENGITILMYGVEGETGEYAPTRPFLEALGLPISASLNHAVKNLKSCGFAYISTEYFCPIVEKLCAIRDLLGGRTVVNSLARALNPLNANHQFIEVAHPHYLLTHAL